MISTIAFRFFMIATLACLSGCSTSTWQLTNSPDLLAAQGKVKVLKEENGNRSVNLEVIHLPKPEKFFSSALTYVVWAAPQDANGMTAQNLGAFTVNDKLEGNLKTVTPHEKFHLFVTAEASRTPTMPSGRKLLWTTVE